MDVNLIKLMKDTKKKSILNKESFKAKLKNLKMPNMKKKC